MADNIGERADPCSTPIFNRNEGDKKLFQAYVVDLLV